MIIDIFAVCVQYYTFLKIENFTAYSDRAIFRYVLWNLHKFAHIVTIKSVSAKAKR